MDRINSSLNGIISAKKHLYPLSVQFEDTDAGGIVYHANYLNYAERGRSAFLRCLGINLQKHLKDERKTILISRIEVDYLKSAQLNHQLYVETSIVEIRKIRLKLEQIIKNQKDGHIFARLQVHAIWVELDKGVRRLPKFLIEKLEKYELRTTN